MKFIKAANKAIDSAGGNQALAKKLAVKTGLDESKLYGRVRMWRIKGVSLPYIRIVARLGKTKISRLVP